MSKGSRDRVRDKKRFDENYEAIQWTDGELWPGLREYEELVEQWEESTPEGRNAD